MGKQLTLTEMVTVGSLVSGLITLLIVTIGWSDFGAGGGVGLNQIINSQLLAMLNHLLG